MLETFLQLSEVVRERHRHSPEGVVVGGERRRVAGVVGADVEKRHVVKVLVVL